MTELSDQQKRAAANTLGLFDVQGPYQDHELHKIYETHQRVMASKEKALPGGMQVSHDSEGGVIWEDLALQNAEANARGAENYHDAMQEAAFEIVALRQQQNQRG